jgi:hypothetical protein
MALPWIKANVRSFHTRDVLSVLAGLVPTFELALDGKFDHVSWEPLHMALLFITEHHLFRDTVELLEFHQISAMSTWKKLEYLCFSLNKASRNKMAEYNILSENVKKLIQSWDASTKSAEIVPVPVTSLRFNFRKRLSGIREEWKTLNRDPIATQKKFSQLSLRFVRDLLDLAVSLVGDCPVPFAMLLVGSSSRGDRFPFSDLEFFVIYGGARDYKVIAYLHTLLGILHLLIFRIQEFKTGFHIDESECWYGHRTKKIVGTLSEIFEENVVRNWINFPGGLVFDGQHIPPSAPCPENLTSLLNAVLVNEKEGQALFAEFQDMLENSLNAPVDEATFHAVELARKDKDPELVMLPTERDTEAERKLRLPLPCTRKFLALVTWFGILKKSCQDFSDFPTTPKANLKSLCHKPLVFFAQCLKCFKKKIQSVHAHDIFEEAFELNLIPYSAKKLFQTLLALSIKLRAKVQQGHGSNDDEVDIADLKDEERLTIFFAVDIFRSSKTILDTMLFNREFENFRSWNEVVQNMAWDICRSFKATLDWPRALAVDGPQLPDPFEGCPYDVHSLKRA